MLENLNRYIDHTLLKPEATQEDIRKLCQEADQYRFASVCMQPVWVKYAVEILKDSPCKICSVVGFPLGANTSTTKAAEAHLLASYGADELDMVLNIGLLKSKDYLRVKEDIHVVVAAAPTLLIKVIIETCLLTDEEKSIAAELCVEAGAHFIKTSTGFSKGGATIEDVILLRKMVGPSIGVKASGGISDREMALQMIEAGASRIGTSRGVGMMESIFVKTL